MSNGRFIQLGHEVHPAGPAADGFGQFVTVDALEKLERDRVAERIAKMRPDMIATGAKVIRAKLEAEAAVEILRKEVHAVAGGDGVRPAFAIMEEEARRQMHNDASRKAQPQATQQQPKK